MTNSYYDLHNETARAWVGPVKGNHYMFRCNACRQDYQIGKMSEACLISHQKAGRHGDNVKLIKSMMSLHAFSKPTSSSRYSDTYIGQIQQKFYREVFIERNIKSKF